MTTNDPQTLDPATAATIAELSKQLTPEQATDAAIALAWASWREHGIEGEKLLIARQTMAYRAVSTDAPEA